MAGSLFRPVVVLALAGSLLGAGAASACPFCTMQGQTLTDEVKQASMVLYGTLANAKPNVGSSDSFDGSTDLNIELVVKKHEILGDKKVLTLSRYLPPAEDGKYRFLVFCDVFKGRIDPYRGIAVKATSDMPKYLKGALELKDAKVSDRLRFFFDYLDNEDLEISSDAYKEFGNSDYKDFQAIAANLPADKVIRWLQDPATPGFRIGLYASMLGHCGKPEHASHLRALLEDPEKKATSGVDGVLAGYTMLQPREGWEYIRGILGDPRKDFLTRYAALRAARFFWENRSDVMPRDQVASAVALLLEQKDIADLAIEDLRKWQRWDLADTIIGLTEKEPYKVPIVRRAILRYALSCPANVSAASKFVEQQRKSDPQAVTDAEELLKLEQPKGNS